MNGEQRRRRSVQRDLPRIRGRGGVGGGCGGSGSSVGQPSSAAQTQAIRNWRHAVAAAQRFGAPPPPPPLHPMVPVMMTVKHKTLRRTPQREQVATAVYHRNASPARPGFLLRA